MLGCPELDNINLGLVGSLQLVLELDQLYVVHTRMCGPKGVNCKIPHRLTQEGSCTYM